MHEISIKFPHILPFSLSQHCYFPPRLALRRPSVRTYSFLPRPSVEREIQMDIVLSPGINHIRCSSGEGRKKDCKEGREGGRGGEGVLLGGLCRNIYSRGWILTAMPHLLPRRLAGSSLLVLSSPPDDRPTDRPTDRRRGN